MSRINQFNLNNTEILIKICKILKKYHVINFTHDITFSNGRAVMLSSDSRITTQYKKNELPLICTNNEGRTLANGAYINDFLIDNYFDCAQLFPKIFDLFSFKNTYSILEKEQDCQHFYTFTFNLNRSSFTYHLINNIYFFNSFINQYKFLMKDLIKKAKHPRHHIILPCSSSICLGYDSLRTVKDIISNINESLIQLEHKDTKKIIKLSPQQSKCFVLSMKGYSLKEIAKQLNLSHRTVEHYIENIRKILNCRNIKELISHYHDQVSIKKLR